MAILQWGIRHPNRQLWLDSIKRVCRQADLVGEGELWIGGLVSLAILTIAMSAYIFSSAYALQYPAEDVPQSTFACDTSIRNAKYESGLQSLATPVSDEEQPMFDLLNDQVFTLHLDLLNTVASCMTLSAKQILGSSSTSLTVANCSNVNDTVSASVLLPYQGVTIQWTLSDIQLIGAVRVGLSGDKNENGSCTLKELDFRQTFYSVTDRTLAQTVTINLQLSKVINETEPRSSGTSKFSGLWYPTFVVDKNQMFISANQYVTSTNLTSTTLTIVISETAFFIQNHQLPIAKNAEIIFHNLLFTLVCLEIFGLVFLLVKLIIIPLIHTITKWHYRTNRIRSIVYDSEDREKKPDHDEIELSRHE